MARPDSETRGASLQARLVRTVTSIWFGLIDAERANVDFARRRMNAVGWMRNGWSPTTRCGSA